MTATIFVTCLASTRFKDLFCVFNDHEGHFVVGIIVDIPDLAFSLRHCTGRIWDRWYVAGDEIIPGEEL